MFTAALFTITGRWKQPKCPSTDERIKRMWRRYTPSATEHYSVTNRMSLCHLQQCGATRDYNTKRSKSERDRQIPCTIASMWNLK